MRRTSAYIISLLFILSGYTVQLIAQDTLDIPLKIRVGLDVSGPGFYLYDNNILNTEGYISVDQNEKRSFVFGGGYLNYKYSQFNYDYNSKGFFIRTGFDFNLMKPEKAMGIYWAGIGLRYGISRFKSEAPLFQQENYWGAVTSSVPEKISWGHFIEASPGVRAEVLRNISIGWTISLRMLLYSGGGKDLRPIYFPGFGNGATRFSSGINYFITWNIPYKRIRVITKPEVVEETEDTIETGTGIQGTGIRQ